MSMSKKDFIALAINFQQALADCATTRERQIVELTMARYADYAQRENPRFNRERWLAYIAGECGPNGGAIKRGKVGAS